MKKQIKERSKPLSKAARRIQELKRKCHNSDCLEMVINKQSSTQCNNCRLVHRSIKDFGYNVLEPDVE
jgi:hypothetical protein